MYAQLNATLATYRISSIKRVVKKNKNKRGKFQTVDCDFVLSTQSLDATTYNVLVFDVRFNR